MRKFIKADLMFDSIKGEFIKDPLIVVKEDEIADIIFNHEELPADVDIIDLEGCTLLPGFIDAHDHLALSPQLENHIQLMDDPTPAQMIRAIDNMKIDLMQGITTSRCLGDKNFIDIYLREAQAEGIIDGPTIITSTRGIKPTHAHGVVGTVFNGPEEIRKAVRENIKQGADFIKLFLTDTVREAEYMPYYMSDEEMIVAVNEAHQAGKKVAAHSIGGRGLTQCIEHGVDIIEHAYFATDEQIEALIKNNRSVVLTPCMFFSEERLLNIPEPMKQKFYHNREEVLERHQAIISSGLTYAVGTDANHGNLHKDVIFFVEIGETLPKALQAITIHAAAVCERENEIGSITIGKKADMVAVKGDLRENVRAIQSIQWVMQDGEEKKRVS